MHPKGIDFASKSKHRFGSSPQVLLASGLGDWGRAALSSADLGSSSGSLFAYSIFSYVQNMAMRSVYTVAILAAVATLGGAFRHNLQQVMKAVAEAAHPDVDIMM